MKKMSLPVAVFVALLGCGLAVIANVTTSRMHEKLEGERYRRIAVEEQLQKADQMIVQLKVELAEAKNKIASIQSILSGTENLKDQLKAVDAQKRALQKQIQELQQQMGAGGMQGETGNY